jgi:chromosome segregation ATPase
MKFIKGYKLISQEELSKLEADAEVRGAKESKQRIDELKRSVEKKNGEIEYLRQQQEDLCETAKRETERLEAKISVLEEERDEVREIEKQSLKNADTVAILNAKEESLDKREKSLDKREEKLADAEETKKMAAYADGLADGLRKAHEITEKDRENALKVAMVSAASHTSPETMKELNNVHQITASNSQK